MDAKEKLITDYAERYAGHPMDKYHDARLYAEAYKHFEAGLNATPSPTGDRDCEELKKEIKELEQQNKYLDELQDQDQITIEDQSNRISELEKEVERLKGLMLQAFYKGYGSPIGQSDETWKDFLIENNL